MGIIISYRGSLDDPSRLGEAVNDIRAFCKQAGWPCEDFSEEYSGVLLVEPEVADGEEEPKGGFPWQGVPTELRGDFGARINKKFPPKLLEETHQGVMVQPPDAETLCLTFNPRGRICHLFEFPAEGILDAIPDTAHYIPFPNSIKVWSAESHAGVCLLLRRLKDKFISNLNVEDDTGFWDNQNYKKLCRHHMEMSSLIGSMSKPGTLNAVLKAAGMPELEGAEVIATNATIRVPKRPKPAKKRRRVS